MCEVKSMKNKKFISVVVSFCLFFSLLVPGVSAYAAEGGVGTGLELKKTVTPNDDGTYKVTLETYATGASVITEVTEDVPTDIILVLDKSGSMDDRMTKNGFFPYTDRKNSSHWSNRNNLWIPIGNGGYASVSVSREQVSTYTYNAITNGRNNSTSSGRTSYWANRDNLYAYVGGELKQVTVSRSGNSYNYTYTYTYTYTIGNTSIGLSGLRGDSSTPTFTGIDDGVLYLRSTDYKYTYTYNDADGVVHSFTSEGANTDLETTLYEKATNQSVTRMQALKDAVLNFAYSVNEKAKGADGQYGTDDDINHRVAVISFNDNASNLTNGLRDMDTQAGYNSVITAVNGLSANGNTQPAVGIGTANTIFSNNPIASGEKRNRVVILFTDGYPAGANTDNIDYGYSDQAIAAAYTSKNTYGATVYTIGIFDGSNPSGDIDTNFVYGDRQSSHFNTTQLVAANRYMHYTSSNYPNAQSLRNGGAKTGSGYYLSASDASVLNSIFQQISSQIEEGGTTTTLTEEAVIKDIIAPSFKLPNDAQASDIKLYLSKYTGEDQWAARTAAPSGITASISGDQVNVTGYDFHKLWCGTETTNGSTTYRGQKLIIEFNIEVRPEFLGGNGVPTNGADSGVYANAEATTPLESFEVPHADVELKDFKLKTPDKNVYENGDYTGLLGNELEISADGGTTWVPFQTWYNGLADWMKAYVKDIKTTPDETDGKYTVSFDLEPTEEGTVKKKTFSAEASLNVFTPVLTFKDETVEYGTTVNEAFFNDNNYLSSKTVWKCGNKLSTDAGVTMTGTKPTVSLTYAPASVPTPVEGGDIPVAVTVKTNDKTSAATFAWEKDNDCPDTCNEAPANAQFRIHCKPGVADLIITKTANALYDVNDRFIFHVFSKNSDGNSTLVTDVVVAAGSSVTIKDLPLGEYTVIEDTNWSRRYDPDANAKDITLSATEENKVSFTNSIIYGYWLSGSAVAVNEAKPAAVN